MPKRTKKSPEEQREAQRLACAKWRAANPDRHKASYTKWRAENRDKHLSVTAKWRAKNPEKVKAYSDKYFAANREKLRGKARRQNLKRYGISLADFERMVADQEGKCAICTRQLGSGQARHIDHCHRTGKNRAVLCTNCNTGIGQFCESTEILQRAIDYLVKHGAIARVPQSEQEPKSEPQLPLFH